MSSVIKPGEFFMMGNFACVEGALAAGCRFYAGYPITPSSEIAERMSIRLPQIGGHFIAMEDEIGSMAAIVGASYGGMKTMTATSGPGFSLMMENIGLGMMTEAPCVLVNVQRAGPSTGIPTLVGQGDIMQCRWGSHGDFESIAYVPNSVQEMFDLTVKAFNAAEKFRQPVFLMADQIIGHMSGRVRIPPIEEISIVERKMAENGHGDISRPFDYKQDFLPMICAGHGFKVNIDSLTHDERGYPSTSHEISTRMIEHLINKIRNHVDEILEYETIQTDDADVLIVAYGCTSRAALRAVSDARREGIKAGLFRPITVWPFPSEEIYRLSQRMRAIVVPEINYGQLVHPVREYAHCPVYSVPYGAGAMPTPEYILDAIRKVLK